jgi:hypothetical protein
VRPYLEKPFTKIELVKWLKVNALSLNPSTTKKKFVEIFKCNDDPTSGEQSFNNSCSFFNPPR